MIFKASAVMDDLAPKPKSLQEGIVFPRRLPNTSTFWRHDIMTYSSKVQVVLLGYLYLTRLNKIHFIKSQKRKDVKLNRELKDVEAQGLRFYVGHPVGKSPCPWTPPAKRWFSISMN
jgi:hypothetical protein